MTVQMLSWVVLAFVIIQRLGELIYSRQNEIRLRKMGGVEVGANHYPFFIIIHSSWLISLALAISWMPSINWWWLTIFVILQFLRVWVLNSLGPYWSTRIITLPAVPLVKSGPYRWMRHPNYAIVVAEIAVLPLVFSAYKIAILFSILNALLLFHRIRVENNALRERHQGSLPLL